MMSNIAMTIGIDIVYLGIFFLLFRIIIKSYSKSSKSEIDNYMAMVMIIASLPAIYYIFKGVFNRWYEVSFLNEGDGFEYVCFLFSQVIFIALYSLLVKDEDKIPPAYKVVAWFVRHPVHEMDMEANPEAFVAATDNKPKSEVWTRVNTKEMEKKTRQSKADREYYEASRELHKAEEERVIAEAKERMARENVERMRKIAEKRGKKQEIDHE